MTAPVYGTATRAWQAILRQNLLHGRNAAPRGLATYETPHLAVGLNLRQPVLCCPPRKLSYRFLAAEALWILDGDHRVETIAPYNQRIADFSDDGVTFFGAYGPRIESQREHVTRALAEDPATRQAVLTIWRENPPKTRDTPCTVALTFAIREEALEAHAFMRSSDAWLGIPYDLFNFAMVALRVACDVNRYAGRCLVQDLDALYLTAASSHLYATNLDGARRCLAWDDTKKGSEDLPLDAMRSGDFAPYREALLRAREAGAPPTF
jgi:thymidylate synthase